MSKKKELTTEDMKRILNTEITPKEQPKNPASFEEAINMIINYNPKDRKKKGKK